MTFAATRGALSALDTVGDGDGVRVGGIGTSTLTLTGSVADINAFVLADNVVYTPLSNDSGDVTLTTTIDDQGQVGAGGPLSASVNRTITIVPVVDGADVRAGAGFLQPTIGVEDPLNGFVFSTLNYRFAPPGNLDETDPRTFALDDGGFVMVWTQSTGTPGILVQRFGANGNPEDSIIAVSPTAAPGDNEPDVAALPNGGFAVAWVETPGDDGASDIEVAVYGNAGPLPTARFTVQSAAAGTAERNPTVTALTDGNLLVTWAVPTGSGTAPSELYAQRFTAAGVEVDASPALISATAAHATPVPVGLSSELYPGDPPAEQTVAALAGGAYAIAWVEAANGGQIHVETFGSNGLSSHAPVVLDLGVGTSTASFIPERAAGHHAPRQRQLPRHLDRESRLCPRYQSGLGRHVMGQLFEPDGDALGTPQVLVLGSDGGGFDFTEFSPSVTALENGRFAFPGCALPATTATCSSRLSTTTARATTTAASTAPTSRSPRTTRPSRTATRS